MDYLQYNKDKLVYTGDLLGFKPYYKWITFNTLCFTNSIISPSNVLNLIINGLPSIRKYRRSKERYS